MSLSREKKVQRSSEVLVSEANGELVMMNIETGKYMSLNEVGSFIWKNLETPLDITEICDKVNSEYEVDKETCETEVISFLEALYVEKAVENIG